jgi:hypothetical protein
MVGRKAKHFAQNVRSSALALAFGCSFLLEAHSVAADPDARRFRLAEPAAISATEALTLEELRGIEGSIQRILEISEPPIVEFQFLSPEQFYGKLALPKAAQAFYRDGVVSVLRGGTTDRSRLMLERSIRHEYVHALVDHMSRGKAPAWLDEGLAVYLEGGTLREQEYWRALGKITIQSQYGCSLSALEESIGLADEAEARENYACAFVAVEKLVSAFGIGAIKRYLERLGTSQSDITLQSEFGLTTEALEASLHEPRTH